MVYGEDHFRFHIATTTSIASRSEWINYSFAGRCILQYATLFIQYRSHTPDHTPSLVYGWIVVMIPSYISTYSRVVMHEGLDLYV